MAQISNTKTEQAGKSTQQPTRGKFLFDGPLTSQSDGRKHSADSLAELNIQPKQENPTQVYLKMPGNYQTAYMELVGEITDFFNEFRELLSQVPSEFQVGQATTCITDYDSSARKLGRFRASSS